MFHVRYVHREGTSPSMSCYDPQELQFERKRVQKKANMNAPETSVFEFIPITMLGLLLNRFEKNCLPLQNVRSIMLYHIELRLNKSFENVIQSLILQNENNLSII